MIRSLPVVLSAVLAFGVAVAVDARTAVPLDQQVLRATMQQTFDQDLAAVMAVPAQKKAKAKTR